VSGYRLRPRAVEDLEQIADFIAGDNPARAMSFIEELIAVCVRIAESPRAFPRRDDLGKGLRQAVHGRYLLLFTADEKGVVIERIVHGARRLEDLI
jgi:toxin ParE1/3/4